MHDSERCSRFEKQKRFTAIARETAVAVLPQRPPARITCVARMAVDVCARHYVCSAAGCGRWVSPSVMAFCDGLGRLICPACARKAAVCGYRRPSKPSVMAVDFCSARKADSDEDFRGARSISCARAAVELQLLSAAPTPSDAGPDAVVWTCSRLRRAQWADRETTAPT